MKTKMPTLSEATRVVCRRRYSNRKSVDNFLIAMKHNIKAIGNLPVNKITKPLVNKMMDTLQQERKNSNAVVNRKMGYLRVVLQEMEEDGYIDMIKMPKPRPTKKGKVHYLTADMEKELLDWLSVNPEHQEAKDIVECLIDIGCRVNELLNIEKRFVDFDNNQINFNDRKNEQAVAVPLTNRVQNILSNYCKNKKDFDEVFSLNYPQLEYIWTKAREDLGYANKDFYVIHLCRHTCGSRLAQRGVALLLIKDWLGHEDIENTMIYAHLQPKALHSVVEVLN